MKRPPRRPGGSPKIPRPRPPKEWTACGRPVVVRRKKSKPVLCVRCPGKITAGEKYLVLGWRGHVHLSCYLQNPLPRRDGTFEGGEEKSMARSAWWAEKHPEEAGWATVFEDPPTVWDLVAEIHARNRARRNG